MRLCIRVGRKVRGVHQELPNRALVSPKREERVEVTEAKVEVGELPLVSDQ